MTVVDLTASGSQPFYIHKAAPAITVTYGTPEQPDPQCISSVKVLSITGKQDCNHFGKRE